MAAHLHRTHFTTGDPDEAYAAVAETFALRHWSLSDTEQFHLELKTTTIGPMTLEATRITGATATQIVDFPVLRIDYLTAGRLAIDGTAGHLTRSVPVLLPPAGYTQHWEHPVVHSIAVDPPAITTHARALTGNDALRLRFTGHRPTTAAATRHLGATLAHVTYVLGADLITGSPLLLDLTVRNMLTAVLHAFPSTLTEAPQPPGQTDPVPAAVRRATAFIDAHLTAPIGITEIADAARMSPRGIQAAFRRHLDTTPLRYLRRARLDAAHRDLAAADPTTGDTVAGIAARWGFGHPGRFAAAYRQAYGQPPTTTLHR